MNEKQTDILLNAILWFIPIFAIFFMFYLVPKMIENDNKIEKTKTVICNNSEKIKKDDIIFDNYYILCENGHLQEIGFELFTKIQNNKNYNITYTKNETLISIDRNGW